MNWISVKERMPENEHTVLCLFPNGEMCVGEYYYTSKEWVGYYCHILGRVMQGVNPTYWMELPSYPKNFTPDANYNWYTIHYGEYTR